MDIVAEDGARSFDNLEQIDHLGPEGEARSIVKHGALAAGPLHAVLVLG